MPEPCECQARKALERIALRFCDKGPDGCSGDKRLYCRTCIARVALSAPCPCEGLREEKATADGFPPEDDRAMEEQMSRAYIETLEAERDQLRAELEKARAYADFGESQIVALCEVIGAEDPELAADKVQRLRAELAEALESVKESEKALLEARSLMFRTAKRHVLGLPCICDTPELHSSICVRLRTAANTLQGVMRRYAAVLAKHPEVKA